MREKRLAYRPMPPLVIEELPDGASNAPWPSGCCRGGQQGHEIVGVNMVGESGALRKRGAGRAPETSAAHNPICGIASMRTRATAMRAGSASVTITQGGDVLWKILAVRPAASSGTNGSGVELRYVEYQGKRVLYRAHVPILNVKYDGNACGPYRDWQNQEGMIQANGTDLAPGFRLCSAPATTILDTGNDTGNFLGVAIFVKARKSCWSARWRPAGIATSASGAFTPTARSGRVSASPR